MKQKHLLNFSLAIIALTFGFAACQNQSTDDTEAVAITELLDTVAETDAVTVTDAVTNSVTEKAIKKIPLTVIVTNLGSPDAPVEMSIFGSDSKKFLAKNGQIKTYRSKPVDGKLIMKIKDISYGEFAMALYQDINSDGKIDKNLIGMPTEPYAFSNNFKPTIKAPSFKDCSFAYNEKTNTVNIALIKK